MAGAETTKNELLRNMKELDNISSMLSKLKNDMKKKEELLRSLEDNVKKNDERLAKKVNEIEEKDKRLDEIEGKLVKRQEELRIQEKEVQTNAILEFLSFQARELEIQDKLKKAPEPKEFDDYRQRIARMEQALARKEEEVQTLRKSLETAPKISEGAGKSDERQIELNKLKANLEVMKATLESKEFELLKKEEEMKTREHKVASQISQEDKKVFKVIEERERELKKLEEQIRNKQREVNKFMEGLEIKENRIKELENEMRVKNELLRMKDEQGEASRGNIPEVKEFKEQMEREYHTKIDLLESNYKNIVDSLKNKIDQLKVRNEELETMGDQLSAEKLRVTLLERELKERMNEISFNEERFARRQELMLKERKQLDEMIKKAKETGDGSKVTELTEEVANRQRQLRDIEMKLKEREDYLRKREQELENLRSSIIDQEMKDEMLDQKEDLNRIRTGVRRFDDLCYGGFAPNSNFILFGPAYSGRRTFTNLFIGEGLKKGIPAIYVTTQHTPFEVKEQLRPVIPKVDAYEQKGLIRFIDLYSKSMGITEEYPNTIYIEKPTDLDAIDNAIGKIQSEFKGKHPYHKMVFFSASTLLTYIEPLNIFRFFQILNAKNKRNNCVAVYIIDTGMHKESDIQTLKHVMTGFIEFKLEDLKYFLRIEGGGDVMSRAWIEYSFTDKTFDLRGSFSLDHIR